MPAVVLSSTDGRADAHAVIETDAGAHAVADARTFPKPDDGDARAHTTAVRGTHTCSVAETVYINTFVEADAVALLLITVLERHDYGCYRLW